MSQSDPNNPYGAPQGGQQYPSHPQGGQQYPSYPQGGEQYPSYPQGGEQYPQPQPYGQPGYPAPGQGPGQPYGQPGANMMPPQMPGLLKAARVLLFVFGGLGIVGGLLTAIGGGALSNADVQELFADQGVSVDESMAGLLITLGICGLVLSIAQIVLAAKFGDGGPGIRIAAIVSAALMIVIACFYLPLGALWILVGILVIVFTAMKESKSWFVRPRH